MKISQQLPFIKNKQTKTKNETTASKMSGSRQPKHAVFCAFPTPPQCPTVRVPCTAPPCLGGNEKQGWNKNVDEIKVQAKKNRDSESQQTMLHGTMLLRWWGIFLVVKVGLCRNVWWDNLTPFRFTPKIKVFWSVFLYQPSGCLKCRPSNPGQESTPFARRHSSHDGSHSFVSGNWGVSRVS